MVHSFSQSELVLGHYQLLEPFDQIEQTALWRGQDQHTQEAVVVKILSLEQLESWDNYQLLEREAQALQLLDHPRIPKVLAYEATENHLILVQEAISGQSLRQRMNQGFKLNEEEARNLTVNILDVLKTLHTQNPILIHRDIKPEHIVLNDQNQVYLQGFGSAREFSKQKYTVAGSFQYMAPEQLQGKAEPVSDLFALGMTLIELLSGQNLDSLPRKGLYLDFEDQLYVSSAFKKWLGHMVSPYPVQRFSSAQVAIESLRSAEYLPQLEEKGKRAPSHKKQALSPYIWLEESESQICVEWIGEKSSAGSSLRMLGITLAMLVCSVGPIAFMFSNETYGWFNMSLLTELIAMAASFVLGMMLVWAISRRFLGRLSKQHRLICNTEEIRHEYTAQRGMRRPKALGKNHPFEHIKSIKLGGNQVSLHLNRGLWRTYRFTLAVPFDIKTRDKVSQALAQRGIHSNV